MKAESKLIIFILVLCLKQISFKAQDTFSIVGLDTITGEVGSAGASCVDLIAFNITDPSFISVLVPGKGAINTQAAYSSWNQLSATNRMNAGDTPDQIIAWMQANDINATPEIRQYGIAAMISGTPMAAAFTGSNCIDYKNHIVGRHYAIQGNILLNQAVLDSIEARFLNTPGTLACKLMGALQGAKVVGADTRCASNNSSSLFAFLKVSAPYNPSGSPYINIGVRTATNTFIEPIDSLQTIANNMNLCAISIVGLKNKQEEHAIAVYPNPANTNMTVMNYSSSEGKYLRLLDLTGRKVQEYNFTTGSLTLDISELSKGVYFLELDDGKNIIYRKKVMKE